VYGGNNMAAEKRRIAGTREWAVAEIDCCAGCSHGCRYCYARYREVVATGRIAPEQWPKPAIRGGDVERDYPLYDGQVMFPANHDIQPEIVDDCIVVLQKLVAAGNKVLVVSKPHLQCIDKICRILRSNREQILFRFSITAGDDDILRFWEPGAPCFCERLASLRHAYAQGYATSVSIEPMLDSENIVSLVAACAPHVSHSIWIGKMNKTEQRVCCEDEETPVRLQRLRQGQTDAKIRDIYSRLKDNPLVRWKESIKEVVQLKLAEKPGEDR